MPCGSCEKRRQMIAEARKQSGVKGVVKSLPKIVRHFVNNRPVIKRKSNG